MLHPLAGVESTPGGPSTLNDREGGWRVATQVQLGTFWREGFELVLADDGFTNSRQIGSFKGRGFT